MIYEYAVKAGEHMNKQLKRAQELESPEPSWPSDDSDSVSIPGTKRVFGW